MQLNIQEFSDKNVDKIKEFCTLYESLCNAFISMYVGSPSLHDRDAQIKMEKMPLKTVSVKELMHLA